MRCVDPDTNGLSYVPSILKNIWQQDKQVRSLFELVQKYCSTNQVNFNVVATHIAEYRATNKLISKFQRETMVERAAPVKLFTFEDWLQSDLWREKTLGGEYVANDSERCVDLAARNKMRYKEVNRIQDAQQQAYDYLIESSLQLNLQHFRRQTKDTLGIEHVVAAKLQEINQYFQEHQDICNEVMLPKKHRGIKWGAKFLLPQHYQAFLNKSILDIYNLELSSYILNINGQIMHFPTAEQLLYAKMEVQIRWFYILQGYKEHQRYEEMLKVKDFRELIEKYGREQELTEQYQKGLEFAPDRELYIKKRIQIHEDILPKFRAGISVRDEKSHIPIQVDVGEYKRIGYEWANNGHNAQPYDLQTTTLRNVTLCPSVPAERRYAIYCQVLYQLASGGALAFHLAFLRQQLNKTDPASPVKPITHRIWQGTQAKKERLFDELTKEGFLNPGGYSKENFLNNQSVQWKQDARSLLYMLHELKSKPYRLFLPGESLGPVVRDNFTNKGGQPFKNVKQNLSGMINTNKTGKPRLAQQIDAILRRVI